MMHVRLVVLEECEFLIGVAVRVKSDLELMSGLDTRCQILVLAFVDSAEEIEGVVLAFFVPDSESALKHFMTSSKRTLYS